MPRSRSGPARSASSASSRPRPAPSPASQPASSGGSGWFGSSSRPQQQQHPAPPPVARAAAAPPPAVASSGAGSGIFSGLMGNIVTGAALGTGSAIAHRAVDSMMGPREVQMTHEHAPAPVAPAASTPSVPSSGYDPCEGRVKAFADCMSRSNGDMQACTYYFDAMQSCKTATSQNQYA